MAMINGKNGYFEKEVSIKNVDLKKVGLSALVIFLILSTYFGLKYYYAKKLLKYNALINTAKTEKDYEKIISSGCPSVLKPVALYYYGKELFNNKEYKKAMAEWEKIINYYPEHYLYGRALIGYIHCYANVNEVFDYKHIIELIKKKKFAWENEAYYDVALILEDKGRFEDAKSVYEIVKKNGNEFWSKLANYKIMVLKNKKKSSKKS